MAYAIFGFWAHVSEWDPRSLPDYSDSLCLSLFAAEVKSFSNYRTESDWFVMLQWQWWQVKLIWKETCYQWSLCTYGLFSNHYVNRIPAISDERTKIIWRRLRPTVGMLTKIYNYSCNNTQTPKDWGLVVVPHINLKFTKLLYFPSFYPFYSI